MGKLKKWKLTCSQLVTQHVSHFFNLGTCSKQRMKTVMTENTSPWLASDHDSNGLEKSDGLRFRRRNGQMRTTSVPTGLLLLIFAGEMSGNFWLLERTLKRLTCLWGSYKLRIPDWQSFARKKIAGNLGTSSVFWWATHSNAIGPMERNVVCFPTYKVSLTIWYAPSLFPSILVKGLSHTFRCCWYRTIGLKVYFMVVKQPSNLCSRWVQTMLASPLCSLGMIIDWAQYNYI